MNDGDDYPFGSLLRGYRVRAEISQQELALKLGKHRNTIGAWELGSSLPKTRSLIVEMGRVLFLANADVGRLLDAAFFSSRLRETEVPPLKQEESTQLTPSPLPTRHDYYAHIPLSPNYIVVCQSVCPFSALYGSMTGRTVYGSKLQSGSSAC